VVIDVGIMVDVGIIMMTAHEVMVADMDIHVDTVEVMIVDMIVGSF
jgi:hypothetical protein